MSKEHVLVLDVGTSSAKAVKFDRSGRVLAEAESSYTTRSRSDGLQEQNPRDWWAACVKASALLGDLSQVELVSLAGTMQSVIPLDAAGEPVRAAILYGDSRAAAVFRQVSSEYISRSASKVLGNHVNELMSVFKIIWMRQHEPELYEAVDKFHSGAKDYVIYRLTGAHVTDPTAATTVGLMDIRKRRWDRELVSVTGISVDTLPRIAPCGEVVGPITDSASRALGLRSGVSVVNGCGDAGAATLGAGVSRAGQAYIYLGSSAWVALVRDVTTLSLPHDLYTLAHPGANLAIRVGAMLSGGDSVAWFREVVGGDFEKLQRALQEIDAEPPELLYLPYLRGERCPFQDPRLRGSFLGLDRSHGPAHLLYAVLEGVACALRTNIDALGIGEGDLRLIGGGAVSEIWPQIIADITGRAISVNEMPTAATAYGAFSIAIEKLGRAVPESQWMRSFHPRRARDSQCERRLRAFGEATTFAREFAERLGRHP
jgi:xylulokinase